MKYYFNDAIRPLIVFLAIAASVLGCLRAQEVPSKVEEYLNSQVLDNGFSGTVLVTHAGDVIVNKSIGSSSTGNVLSIQVQSQIPIGSISEQFIAVAALQLEGGGKFSLDSPICEYISNCPKSWGQIHILHLLTHSSGLPNLEGDLLCSETPAVALSGESLLFMPGYKFNDNKLDYLFVQLAIEKNSGQSIKKYVEDNIFRTLNLKQTYVKLVQRTDCPQGGHMPNGTAWFSTVDDLSRWENALSTDKVLPKDLQDRMFVPYVEGHAFGWKIIKEFDKKVALQSSELGPISASIRRYPDDDITIIVVSRVRNVSSSALSHDLGAILFGKHYPVNARPAPSRPTP